MFEFRPQSFKVRSKPEYSTLDLPPEAQRAISQRKKYEKKIERAFFKYVENLSSNDVQDQVAAMYRNGDLMGMMHLPDPFIREFADVIREVFIAVGDEEMKNLLKVLNIRVIDENGNPVQKVDISATIDISFNPGNASAAAYLRQSELEFIREITKQQREVIRRAMSEALERGIGPIEASRLFKSEIGLTTFQQNAVRNYRRLLEQNSGQALSRVLRDRRFDPTVSRAIRTGAPLSAAQINNMTDRYRSRMLSMRAETIARTEGQAAVNAARHHSTSQMLQQAGIQEDAVERIWHTVIDGRERRTHNSMNKQVRGYNEKFQSPSGARLMFPGDRSAPAAEVINCRCVLETRMKEAAESENLTLLAQPKTPKGYRNMAERSTPSPSFLDAGTPSFYGEPIASKIPIDVAQNLARAYTEQLATRIDRKLTTYLATPRTTVPGGSLAKLPGKEFGLAQGAEPFLDPLKAVSSRGSKTILKINIPKGSHVLFGSAEAGQVTLAPNVRLVVKSARYVNAAEYAEATGIPKKLVGQITKPGKRGYLLVEVDLTNSAGSLEQLIQSLNRSIADRLPRITAFDRDVVALVDDATPLYDDVAASVQLKVPDDGTLYSTYTRGAFGSANDLGRKAINSLKPIKTYVINTPAFKGRVGHIDPELYVMRRTPGLGDYDTYRHEFGHYLDEVFAGKRPDNIHTLSGYKASEKTAQTLVTTHQKWDRIATQADELWFKKYEDAANYVSSRYGISEVDLLYNNAERLNGFLRAHIRKFEIQSGFDLNLMFREDEVLEAYNFARGVMTGNARAIDLAIDMRQYIYKSVGNWSPLEIRKHMVYDYMGSISRLEYGGGHGFEYYTDGYARKLIEGLPSKVTDMANVEMSYITSIHTAEAFANWFALYTEGPGGRFLLQKLTPDLNRAFENILKRGTSGFLGWLF